VVPTARELAGMGFRLVATRGTAACLRGAGLEVEEILKVSEGRPNGVDKVIDGEIALILNTPLGNRSFSDEHVLRQVALAHGVPVLTTLSAARAATRAIGALRSGPLAVRSLQERFADVAPQSEAG